VHHYANILLAGRVTYSEPPGELAEEELEAYKKQLEARDP
jgi:hypothetical protein